MRDQQNPNDPHWDWLYQESAAAGEEPGDGPVGANPDHTTMLPQSPRPEAPAAEHEEPPTEGGAAAPVWQQPAGPAAGAGDSGQASYTRPLPTAERPAGAPRPMSTTPAPTAPPGRSATPAATRTGGRRRRIRWVRIVLAA